MPMPATVNPTDPTTKGTRSARLAGSARRGLQQGIDVLRRLVPLASRVARGVRFFAIATMVVSVVIVLAVLSYGIPSNVAWWLFLVALIAWVAWPPAVLWLFHHSLVEAIELPERILNSPDIGKEYASQLVQIVQENRGGVGNTARRATLGDAWRSGRLLIEAKRDLPGYARALRLVSLPFLFLVLVAFAAALWSWVMVIPTVLTAIVF